MEESDSSSADDSEDTGASGVAVDAKRRVALLGMSLTKPLAAAAARWGWFRTKEEKAETFVTEFVANAKAERTAAIVNFIASDCAPRKEFELR